jgi:N-acylglucosamine-6-phosphate 2-epimerase
MPVRHPAQPRQVLASLAGGLVVSCQARPGNPMHGPAALALMAQAAELGGARGLRVNGPADLAAIRGVSSLPIMAINKVEHGDSPVMITPTLASARSLLDAGARIVALDATARTRPDGERLRDIVQAIHDEGAVAMGDLAGMRDLATAMEAEIDAVGTTLSGYTGGQVPEDPDFALLSWLVRHSPVPVFAEGRYWTREQVVQAFELGASFVVVGTAITNPMAITSRFVEAIAAMDREDQHGG